MSKRTLIYINAEPGPGKKFYVIVYWPGFVEPEIRGGLKSQRQHLAESRALAKTTAAASIYIQGTDGAYKEVYSYPSVRNSDERKRKKTQ